MERRGFLKGLFGGITSAGLVVAASQADLAAFAAPLVKDAPVLLDVPLATPYVEAGEHLYNVRGELVAIVQSITYQVPNIDVTLWGDSQRTYLPGLPSIDITARGIGVVEWDIQKKRPQLRGQRR